jgi:hypothetical protein
VDGLNNFDSQTKIGLFLAETDIFPGCPVEDFN